LEFLKQEWVAFLSFGTHLFNFFKPVLLQAGSGIAALQEGSKRGIGSLPSDEDELIFNFKRVTAQG